MSTPSFTRSTRLGGLAGVAGLVALAVAACTGAATTAPAPVAPAGASSPSPAASMAASPAPSASPAASMAASPAPSASPAAGGGYGQGGRYGSPSPSPAASPSAAVPPSTGGATVKVAIASGSPGKFLTGAGGMTLYTYKPDSASKSACTGSCAQNWPPFVVPKGATIKAPAAASGKFATIARADGSRQVTYKGHPLYYFLGDSSAGDATGQGTGGVWFVAAP